MDMNLIIFVTLAMEALLPLLCASENVTVQISTVCESGLFNCNCRASIDYEGTELALQEPKAILLNIITIDSLTGRANRLYVRDTSEASLNKTYAFLETVGVPSVIIMLTQGCFVITYNWEALIDKYELLWIDKWSYFEKVKLYVGCIGNCPVDEFFTFSDTDSYEKSITFPILGKTSASDERSLLPLVLGLCGGGIVLLFLVMLLLYFCICRHKKPHQSAENGEGRKGEENIILNGSTTGSGDEHEEETESRQEGKGEKNQLLKELKEKVIPISEKAEIAVTDT